MQFSFDELMAFAPKFNSESVSRMSEKNEENALLQGDAEFNEFEAGLSTKKIFKISFTASSKDGSLYTYKGDGQGQFMVKMPKTEATVASDVSSKINKPMPSAILLEKEFFVIVTDINRDAREVTVSYRGAVRKLARHLDDTLQDLLQKRFLKGSNNTPIKVVAKVIRNEESKHRYIVDINGWGILAFVPYTLLNAGENETDNFKTGNLVEIDIIDKKKPAECASKCPLYVGSRKTRKDISPENNPWSGIEEKFPVGTSVNFTCVRKTKTAFFSVIDGLNGLELYCHYPDKATFPIIIGHRYQGFINKVNEENHAFFARTLRMLDKEEQKNA